MKMNEKFYVAPEVEVVEVAIEQGFAATEVSGVDKDLTPDVPSDF